MEKVDSEQNRKKLQFPYVVQVQYEQAQQPIPIYNNTVYKNKELCCPKCDCVCHNLTTPTGHKGGNSTCTMYNNTHVLKVICV